MIPLLINSLMALVLLLFLLSLLSGCIREIEGLEVGINYGRIGNNLPTPMQVASLLQSIQVTKVKLYDADPGVLQSFAGSNVEFIIGLGNEYLYNMTDPNKAQSWVQTHVQPYVSQTKITCIVVGNEVFTETDTQLMSYVLPAMQNVYSALKILGLSNQITVTHAHSVGILGSSYPPSTGSFKPELAEYLQPMLNFHAQIKAPFLINAYPFFAYKADPNHVSLDYVLFRPNQGNDDPYTNLHYDNMLFAQIDSVYAAIKRMGHADIEVQVSETGWPSKGDPNEYGATPDNAAAYNGNLIRRVERREGTPGKPTVPITVYVFALFNENMKPGPGSERNYGLYYPDGSPVYNVGLQGYLPQFYTFSSSQIRLLGCYALILVFNLLTALIILV